MTQHPQPALRRAIAAALLAIFILSLFAPPAPAADLSNSMGVILPGFDMMDIVHDRSRMIQFSIVAVAIGIGLLWWGNKT